MSSNDLSIEIRECTTVEEMNDCVMLQREVFAMPDLEISPSRHLIVSRTAGGYTLGAYNGDKLIGFVLSIPGFRGEERYFYSHMAAVRKEFQSVGIGAKLKWAQRDKALSLGVNYIKWTFEPVQARNAYFNLERLGAVIREYTPNYYGADHTAVPEMSIQSDRLFAEWHLDSQHVINAAHGVRNMNGEALKKIITTPDWKGLLRNDPAKARDEQLRIRSEFQEAFAKGLVCKGFERDDERPAYLLF